MTNLICICLIRLYFYFEDNYDKALKLAKRAEETSNVETSGSEAEQPTKRARNNPNYVESEGNLNYITSIIGIYTG